MLNEDIQGINFSNPTGREKNPCPICDKPFKEGEEVMCYVKGNYRQHINWGLIHSKCFFKLLLMKYNFNLDEIKKEIVMERLK